MAIYGAVPPPEHVDHPVTADLDVPPPSQTPVAAHVAATPTAPIDIEAWTVSALESLSVSPVARGTGAPLLAINLDEQAEKAAVAIASAAAADNAPHAPNPPIRRPLSRRDSQKKRDALLKGSEGSRQRRRWENDRLVGVPNAQPPLPSDWEVHPTYPVQVVPYQVAQFWDTGLRQRIEDKTSRLQAQRKKQQRKDGSATGLGVGEVPRDLRDTAKRTPAVRGWVRVLEEPVRAFLAERSEASDAEGDSEDDEIVFVGRRQGTALTGGGGVGWKKARREVGSEPVDTGMVFDALGADDESASFKYAPATRVPQPATAAAAEAMMIMPSPFADLLPQAMADPLHLGLLRPPVPLRHHGRARAQGRLRHGTRPRRPRGAQEAYGPAPPAVGDVLSLTDVNVCRFRFPTFPSSLLFVCRRLWVRAGLARWARARNRIIDLLDCCDTRSFKRADSPRRGEDNTTCLLGDSGAVGTPIVTVTARMSESDAGFHGLSARFLMEMPAPPFRRFSVTLRRCLGHVAAFPASDLQEVECRD
ncbi:R3H-associated N-terminal domain-containing protein [Colletotrichum cereale]|nr:R3H-associated N-terminal domain-containing protein [Colletotrichum cereale]